MSKLILFRLNWVNIRVEIMKYRFLIIVELGNIVKPLEYIGFQNGRSNILER